MGWGRTDPHVWEHHVLAWAWLESPPGVAMAVSQASRTERRGGGGAAQGAHSDLAHWPPCPEGGLAGRLPQAAPIEAPSSQHLSPWIKSPRGHERVRALGLSACLLQFFLEHLQISVSAPGQPTRPLPGPMPVPRPGAHSVGPSHLPLPSAVSSAVLSWAVDRGPQESASVLSWPVGTESDGQPRPWEPA